MATQGVPYPTDQPIALFEGQLRDTSDRTISTSVSDTDEIPFGRAVVRDTAGASDKSVKLPSGAGDVFVGASVYTADKIFNEDSNGEAAWPVDTEFATATNCFMLVKPEVDVLPEEPVFFRHTANGPLDVLGRFRNDADTANAKQVNNARFVTSASADEFAVIQITQTN